MAGLTTEVSTALLFQDFTVDVQRYSILTKLGKIVVSVICSFLSLLHLSFFYKTSAKKLVNYIFLIIFQQLDQVHTQNFTH